MLSHPSIDALLPEEKSQAIAELSQNLREGRVSPTDIYADIAEERETSRMFSFLTWGAATSLGLSAVALASGGGALLAVILFGVGTGGNGYFAIKRFFEFKEDIRDDMIGDWLTDDEWEDLEALCKGVPETADPLVKEKTSSVLKNMLEGDSEESAEGEKDVIEPAIDTDYEVLTIDDDEEEPDGEISSWTPQYSTKSSDNDWSIDDNAPRSIFDDHGVSPEFLSKTKQERATILLRELKSAGCDIEQFVGDRMIGATGNQGSGKSTILMILAIIESALNDKQITYVTCDDDIYPVKFTRIYGGDIDTGKQGYQAVIKEISALKKGSARDRIWFLDECTKTLRSMGKQSSTDLWNNLMTGFAKTGGCVRLVMHGKTATSMGIPAGYSDQAKSELLMLGALWARSVGADYKKTGKYPSGTYHVLEAQSNAYESTGEVIKLPDWLKFVKVEGREGDMVPCYVHSALELFPELDARLDKPNNYELPSDFLDDGGDEDEIEEWVNALERVANEIRKQCAIGNGTSSITIKMAAQCFSGEKKSETEPSEREGYYPLMEDICRSLQSMYPDQFKVIKGSPGLRIMYLPAAEAYGIE
ncbi:hypothetical protein N836_31435 [Leptolyngbya sp. Heron Island J]|uniref:ATP-binding protein n=1 Tax=Leptolyngbya sp. Heron Island J TaxID=1385935 RepID=UPI0003B96E51|nr:ATP-binding protein [Leptolyngbya sp. Heron Island J]ESA38455.1 hypothetical protein N836_31435 [Leptolyngbya sp. Heron Island J]